MQKKNYVQEILDIIHSGLPQAELAEKLSDYHENDLADALTALTPEERQKVYTVLGVDTVAEIFSPSGPPGSSPTWIRTMPWMLWMTWKRTIRQRSSTSWTRMPPMM